MKAINEKRKQYEILRKLSMQAPVSKPVMSRLSDFICRRNETKNQSQSAQQTAAPVFSMMNFFRNTPTTSSEPAHTQSAPIAPQPSHTYPQPVQSFQQPMQSYPPPVQSFSQPMQTFTHPTPFIPQTDQAYSQPVQSFAQSGQVYSQPKQVRSQPSPNFPHASNQQQYQQTYQTGHYNQTPVKQVNNWFTKNELRRRPLRNYDQRDIPQMSFSSTRPSIRDKFMSAFGLSSLDHDKPAGLRNEGQNLCFMNCVIQCLSHTPFLVERLGQDAEQELDCSEAESVMINVLLNLMSQCKKTKRERQNMGILDPTGLREAMSALRNGLVVPPMERQNQQDAAEFFMWLMETLHNALNKKTVRGKEKLSCATYIMYQHTV